MTEYPSTWTNVGGGQNWDQNFTGAGVLDGMAQTVRSIQNGDWVSVGANALSAGIDALGFIENPVKALGATAIGWIIEHLTVLDAFLDRTTGDPGAVQNAAETFYKAAQDLDGIAADQIRSFGMDVANYRSGQSPSAVTFEQRIGPRGDQLKALSLQCQGLGEAMNTAGLLVATCRGIMRDALTEFAYWVFRKGVIALAAAPYTGGGSLTFFLTDSCVGGAKLARNLADEVDTLIRNLKKLEGRVGRLVATTLEGLEKLAKPLGDTFEHAAAVSVGKNYVTSGAKALDDSTTLSAADAAAQQVAEHDAAEERGKHADGPLLPPPPEPVTPLPPAPEEQGPGLNTRWTAHGTLDE
ncbi:hypothetical protein [Actinophytocola sp.]|uniref:hypothetical protein n=1 Tax=Actinophytocola sp. TaxID=1872138 RepID=UPI00389A6314